MHTKRRPKAAADRAPMSLGGAAKRATRDKSRDTGKAMYPGTHISNYTESQCSRGAGFNAVERAEGPGRERVKRHSERAEGERSCSTTRNQR